MILCVDVDNVLGNLQEVVTNLFNERYGTNYTLDDFTDYNIENVLPVKEAINMQKMYGDNNIYSYVKPISGAQESLQRLVNTGHQVYLVTDAIPQNYNDKINWLHHFFPFIDNAHIIAMKHKWLLRADVMIEDNLTNLLARPYYERIVLDYPWNRNVTDYVYDIHRCTSWDEIIDAINKIDERE